MQTFSVAVQDVNIDDHIVARFEAGTVDNPDDYAKCRLTVWHEGGEASVVTFDRNGLVIGSVLIPPPEPPAADQAAAASKSKPPAADDSSSSKGSKK